TQIDCLKEIPHAQSRRRYCRKPHGAACVSLFRPSPANRRYRPHATLHPLNPRTLKSCRQYDRECPTGEGFFSLPKGKKVLMLGVGVGCWEVSSFSSLRPEPFAAPRVKFDVSKQRIF